ncbi:MAG: addiction module protein [Woeseiaceae bacterium]|nr:addiction module protein [Woeseiaceae bacterium]
MKPEDSSIEDQISRLPDEERARLALKLLESLEPGEDEDVDALWLDEAERRLKLYDEGASEGRDAEEVISEIERQLK